MHSKVEGIVAPTRNGFKRNVRVDKTKFTSRNAFNGNLLELEIEKKKQKN